MERRRERVKHERETDRVTRTEDERPVSSLPFPFLSSHSLPRSSRERNGRERNEKRNEVRRRISDRPFLTRRER